MTVRHLTLLLAGLLALASVVGGARAETGQLGFRLALGPPRSPHAMPGVDAARSRRVATTLSLTPHVERRLRVAYGVGRGLVTRDDGGFFTLHSAPRASRFDAQGKLLYSLRFASEPGSAPVVTAAGAVAFVVGGELLIVDDRGRARSHTPLNDADLSARSILASEDGGVVLASGTRLLKVSAQGDLVWQSSSPETPLELFEIQHRLWCITTLGSVYLVDGAGRLNKRGELGGATHAVTVAPQAGRLLARNGNHRLVRFDLAQQQLGVSVEDAGIELDGPVFFDEDLLSQVFTTNGLLLRYRPDGSEAQRVLVDPGARKAPGSDDAIVLGDGRLLVARAGAEVVLVTPTGDVSAIAGSACPDPVGLFGLGPQAVLLACRSGNMLRIE